MDDIGPLGWWIYETRNRDGSWRRIRQGIPDLEARQIRAEHRAALRRREPGHVELEDWRLIEDAY